MSYHHPPYPPAIRFATCLHSKTAAGYIRFIFLKVYKKTPTIGSNLITQIISPKSSGSKSSLIGLDGAPFLTSFVRVYPERSEGLLDGSSSQCFPRHSRFIHL